MSTDQHSRHEHTQPTYPALSDLTDEDEYNEPLPEPVHRGTPLLRNLGLAYRLLATVLTTLIIKPTRFTIDYLLSYNYVHVLSIHNLGARSHGQKHHIVALFSSGTAARLAVTEVLSLPEYRERVVKTSFLDLGKWDPGMLVSTYGDLDVDGGVVVMVQKMFVRRVGL